MKHSTIESSKQVNINVLYVPKHQHIIIGLSCSVYWDNMFNGDKIFFTLMISLFHFFKGSKLKILQTWTRYV